MRIALTPRDIAIFQLLGNYRYLRSTYLHAFVGGASQTRFKERLGDLFHEGFIDRPEKQWELANARHHRTHPAMLGVTHVKPENVRPFFNQLT